MNDFAQDIGNINYREWNKQEISDFEVLGSTLKIDKKTKKQELKSQITHKNIALIDAKANDELTHGEFVDIRFKSQVTGMQFLSTFMFSADYLVMPPLFRDVGLSYIVYGSTNKMMIYEVGELGKIHRKYIMAYTDIKKYKHRTKKDYTTIYLKIKRDKYRELRECSNWLLYGYLQNRINMNFSGSDQDKIIQYFDRKFK